MTGPREAALPGSRRPRARLGGAGQVPAAPVVDADDLDLLRGQAAAVLAALGRMQLRLDVLAHEQAEQIDRLVASVEELRHALLEEHEHEHEPEPEPEPRAAPERTATEDHAPSPEPAARDEEAPSAQESSEQEEPAPPPAPAYDPYYVVTPPTPG